MQDQTAQKDKIKAASLPKAGDDILRRADHWEKTRQDVIGALDADQRAVAVSAHHVAKKHLSTAVTTAWAKHAVLP